MNFCRLALFIFLIKVAHGVAEEGAPCEPGFKDSRYAFSVTRKVLERRRILGKVTFEPCSTKSRALYSPSDSRFGVSPDGTVTVKRQLTLHDASVSFVLNAWDSTGGKHSVPVLVWNERELQIKSSRDRQIKVYYSITGPLHPPDIMPAGVCIIEREMGWLVMIVANAESANGQQVEGPMEIPIKVLDQNYNRPVFKQPIFQGSVMLVYNCGSSAPSVCVMLGDCGEEDLVMLWGESLVMLGDWVL
ncbi:cadherin-1-like [Pelodytes ibericus]